MNKKGMFIFIVVFALIFGTFIGASADTTWKNAVLNKADAEVKKALKDKWDELVEDLEADINNIVATESDLYMNERIDSATFALEQYYYGKLNGVKTSDEFLDACEDINNIVGTELQKYKGYVDSLLN